jgi:hypothetical protein
MRLRLVGPLGQRHAHTRCRVGPNPQRLRLRHLARARPERPPRMLRHRNPLGGSRGELCPPAYKTQVWAAAPDQLQHASSRGSIDGDRTDDGKRVRVNPPSSIHKSTAAKTLTLGLTASPWHDDGGRVSSIRDKPLVLAQFLVVNPMPPRNRATTGRGEARSEDRGGRLSLKGTKPARTQYKNGKRTDHNVYINIKSSLKTV